MKKIKIQLVHLETDQRQNSMGQKLQAIAYHEAGHAFADWHFHFKVKKATIVPKDDAAGYVESKTACILDRSNTPTLPAHALAACTSELFPCWRDTQHNVAFAPAVCGLFMLAATVTKPPNYCLGFIQRRKYHTSGVISKRMQKISLRIRCTGESFSISPNHCLNTTP
jgi:hypothetical protein